MPAGTAASWPPLAWSLFAAFVLAMVALDLGLVQRRGHSPGFRAALCWTAVWIALAGAFGAWLLAARGTTVALEFYTGYAVELSLSMDNVFVFLLIFNGLGIPRDQQHRVLFWGVLTAMLLRGAMILAGAALIARYEWILYVFGAFLIWVGLRQLHPHRGDGMTAGDRLLAFLRRRCRVTHLHGSRFVVRIDGQWAATPLLLALVLVEISDVVFAVDSIPAIFAVTRDPFLVFTANMFAILGLRSLFFVLAGMLDRFHYLRYGLAAVLVFIGGKLLLLDVIHVAAWLSLCVVVGAFGIALLASWLRSRHG